MDHQCCNCVDLYFPKTEKEGKRYREQPKGTWSGGEALEEGLDTDGLVKKAPAKEGDDEREKEMRQTESEN